MRSFIISLAILVSVGCGESAKERNARIQRGIDARNAASKRESDEAFAIRRAKDAEEMAEMTAKVDQHARALNAWIEDQNQRLEKLDVESQMEVLKHWRKAMEDEKRSD